MFHTHIYIYIYIYIYISFSLAKSSSRYMKHSLTHYQSDKPMVPFLAEDLTSVLKGRLKRVIKQGHIPNTAVKLMNFNVDSNCINIGKD